MLIICEDCAKKYNIDDSRIRGSRARFTCKACGHIIIVNKSDTTRTLISSASNSQFSDDSGEGTIDLLKEMEAPSKPDTSEEAPGAEEKDQHAQEVKNTPPGKPVCTFILTGILVAFICISGSLGYVYITVLKGSVSANLFGNALVVLGVAWGIVTVVFLVIARSISKPLRMLTKDVHRICQGEENIHFVSKGPREIRELANALSKLNDRVS